METVDILDLGHLSPHDYLIFMQGEWAYVTELTPEKMGFRGSFMRFSEVLNKLEALVVEELKPGKEILPEVTQRLEALREEMDGAYQELQKAI